MQQRDHPATGADQDLTHVLIVRRLVGHEDAVVRRNGTFRKPASLACAMCVEDDVGHEHVEVHVELEGQPEALHEWPHDGRLTPCRRRRRRCQENSTRRQA